MRCLLRFLRLPKLGFSLAGLIMACLLAGSAIGLYFRYPPWALERTLHGHMDEIFSAAFSQDGRRIVTVERSWARSWEGERIFDSARIWDAESGKVLAVLNGHQNALRSFFSPDGRRIVTVNDDKTACVWDAETGKKLAELEWTLDSAVYWVSFSPDNRRVLMAWHDHEHIASIWDAETGKLFAELNTNDWGSAAITNWRYRIVLDSAAFSPDGRRVVTVGHDRHIALVWDAETGEPLAETGEPPANRNMDPNVRSAAFSPDGRRIVTACGDATTRVWNAETGTELFKLNGREYFYFAAFSPDGRRIVTGEDCNAGVWDAETGKRLAELKQADVSFAAFSPDGGRIVAISDYNTARVWIRRRPEYWWGVAWLPESWLGAVCLILLARLAIRRWKLARVKKAASATETASVVPL